MEFVIPAAAVDTGNASIPPPMDVPTISNIPPMSLELGTCILPDCLNIKQYDN